MLKKRLVLLILTLCFLFINQALALEVKEIHDGTHAPFELFEANNVTFYINLLSDNEKLEVRMGDAGFSVDKGSCNVVEDLQFCFQGVESWYHNYTTDRDYYKAHVKINQLIAKLVITREIEQTKFMIGEVSKITTTIKNTGSIKAENVKLRDEFSSSLGVQVYSGCFLEGKTVTWDGSLEINGEKKCDYDLKGINQTGLKSEAKVEYFNGMTTLTAKSEQVKFIVPDHYFNIVINSSSDSLKLGDDAEVKVTVTNTHGSKTIGANPMVITFDKGINILESPPSVVRSDNQFSWTNTIDSLQQTEFVFKIKLEKSGSQSVNVNADYNIGSLRNNVKKSYTFNVSVGKPNVAFNLKDNYEPGDDIILKVDVDNPTMFFFKDISVVIRSDLFDEVTAKVNELRSKTLSSIFYKELILPEDFSKSMITAFVNYSTEYGEKFTTMYTKEISVLSKEPEMNETNITIGTDTNETATINETAFEESQTNLSEKSAANESGVELEPDAKGVVQEIKKTILKTKLNVTHLIIIAIAILVIVDVYLVRSIYKKLQNKQI